MIRARFVAVALASLALASCGNPAVPPAQNYGTIRGRVYDQATNAGISGVTVQAYSILTAVTGPDGSYTIHNAPLGAYTVQLAPRPQGYTGNDTASGSIAAGETITVDFPLTHT